MDSITPASDFIAFFVSFAVLALTIKKGRINKLK